MIDLDKWLEIWATLRRNKLRTFLTGLAVLWGMLMLVGTVAFARGFQAGVARSMGGFATNAVYVWGQRTTLPYQGLPPGRGIRFKNSDIEAVAQVPGIEHLAPRIRMGGWPNGVNVTHNGETGNFAVMGDFPQFAHIMNINLLAGRFVDRLDVSERRKVAVIGDQVRDVLFAPGEDPIGRHVNIQGVWFQVIGVFAPTAQGNERDRQAQTLMLPFTTVQQAFNLQNRVGYFALTVDPDFSAPAVETEIKQVLAGRHEVDPTDAEAFGSFNAASEFGKIQTVLMGIELFAWGASLITLLAGALGVANILLISVKERTKEIGVRKALGATPGSVVRMILQEAIVITSVAGYFGLVAAVGIVEMVAGFIPPDGMMGIPTVDFSMAITCLVILVGSAALAGLIPALHAARIPPVAALRAEP